MSLSRFKLCLLLVLFADVNAFQQGAPGKKENLNLDIFSSTKNAPPPSEIDIEDLLAEVDSFLAETRANSKKLPSAPEIDEQKEDSDSSFSLDQNPWIVTAVVGSIIGTTVGSPIVMAAYLGFAGLQFLDSQDGKKNRKILEQGFLLDSPNSAKNAKKAVYIADDIQQAAKIGHFQ